MKKLFFLLVVTILLLGCELDFICPDTPKPAKRPNQTSVYEDPSSGYKSVSYTYHCLRGKYQVVTWTRTQSCGSWKKSVYKSSCI